MPRTSFNSIRGNKIFQNPLLKFLNGVKLELFVLFVTFSFIFAMNFTFLLLWGWYGPTLMYPALSYNAAGQNLRGSGLDSDGDGLPDVIESGPEGVRIYNQRGDLVGWGTGTNPYNPDTDGDFFSDGLENSMGTNPHSWLNPGITWIFWLILLVLVIYFLFFRKVDRTKQYTRNEEKISGTTIKGKSKFSYSMPEVTLEEITRGRSTKDIHNFRTSLASDIFEIDDETALGYALHQKRANRVRATVSVTLSIIFTLWAYLDAMDKIINDKYDTYPIDKVIGAGIKFSFAVISLLAFFYFKSEYDKSDHRSRQFLAD